MNSNNSLFLHEEILLLALKDEEGTIASGAMYHYAIGGAILAEMLLNNYISIEKVKKSKLVTIVNYTKVYDTIIQECLDKIHSAKRRASLQTWVSRFAGIKHLKHQIAKRLCEQGILRADEEKILLIFKRKIYPELNPEPERLLVDRLRKAIFTDSNDIDPRTIVLISLASNTGILKAVFDKKELKARKKRIEQMVHGEITGKATKEAIDAMLAAVMVTAIIPTIIATTATH